MITVQRKETKKTSKLQYKDPIWDKNPLLESTVIVCGFLTFQILVLNSSINQNLNHQITIDWLFFKTTHS